MSYGRYWAHGRWRGTTWYEFQLHLSPAVWPLEHVHSLVSSSVNAGNNNETSDGLWECSETMHEQYLVQCFWMNMSYHYFSDRQERAYHVVMFFSCYINFSPKVQNALVHSRGTCRAACPETCGRCLDQEPQGAAEGCSFCLCVPHPCGD